MEPEYSHTVSADFVVGLEVERHQAFWMCDMLQHNDLQVVSIRIKAGLVTEDNTPCHSESSLTVWHDTAVVFGKADVVLRAVVVVVPVCMHVVMCRAPICQWSWH